MVIALMTAPGLFAQDTAYYETWDINNLDIIGGHSVTYLGDPEVVSTEIGDAVEFDGEGDRLLVDANPIGKAKEFTVEVIFWPDAAYPDHTDPRFVHIQDPDDPLNKRVMIELRVNQNNECYLDGFMLTDNDNLALIDESMVHPTETWLHAAITYKEGVFKTYMNREEELSGNVSYQDLILEETGKTSLGSRMDERAWFSGKIKTLKVTRKALTPAEFLSPPGSSTSVRIDPFHREPGNGLSVYPVPVDDELTINTRSNTHSKITVRILDLLGKDLKTRVVMGSHGSQLKVDTSQLENGIYLVQFCKDELNKTRRILIQHRD